MIACLEVIRSSDKVTCWAALEISEFTVTRHGLTREASFRWVDIARAGVESGAVESNRANQLGQPVAFVSVLRRAGKDSIQASISDSSQRTVLGPKRRGTGKVPLAMCRYIVELPSPVFSLTSRSRNRRSSVLFVITSLSNFHAHQTQLPPYFATSTAQSVRGRPQLRYRGQGRNVRVLRYAACLGDLPESRSIPLSVAIRCAS